MVIRRFKPAMLVCVFAVWLAGCSVSERREIQAIYGYAMGTSYSVKVVSTLTESRHLQLGIDRVLANIDDRMSTYKPTSDISKFGSAAVNVPIAVDAKTAEVVNAALNIAATTHGAFDPTIEPLVDLWGFGPTVRNKTVPTAAEIQHQLDKVGYTAVRVSQERQTITKTEPRELDLSAIAKGYAVDEVADFIEEQGFTDYLVEVGGEMRFSGRKPNNVEWAIAIEKPVVNERTPFQIVKVETGAMATSGDYRNYFEVEGQRFSHTIDPATGYPVDHNLASVTVVMSSCMAADAYATAFNVLGLEKGLKLAESLQIAAFFIYRDNTEFVSVQSTAFSQRFGHLIN